MLKTIFLLLIPFTVQSQSLKKELQKSWIKVGVEDLSLTEAGPDTLYTRYVFDKNSINISFYPAWNDYTFQWSLSNPLLIIGLETYVIEELTDSTLVFSRQDFRRYRFVAEAQYSKLKQPDTTLPFNEKTVYVASNYLTPRYKKATSLYPVIQSQLEKVRSVKTQSTFTAKFIVTDQGNIEHVRIINGIAADYDEEFIKQIKKTSKDWYPAKINNIPVNCEMTYVIKYLQSLTPNSGIISGGRN